MNPEFKIFKKGTTEKPITIYSGNSIPFNRDAKIKKYLRLGYTVFELDGTEIHGTGQIDQTWQEVNLSSFLKDNPTLISDLRKSI